MHQRPGWIVTTAAAVTIAISASAQTGAPAPTVAIVPDGAPTCSIAIITTPPATTVRARAGAPGTVHLIVATLTDPPLAATASLSGGALRVRIVPHGNAQFCEVPFRVTGLPAGSRAIVVDVDTGRGPLVEVAHAAVVVR